MRRRRRSRRGCALRRAPGHRRAQVYRPGRPVGQARAVRSRGGARGASYDAALPMSMLEAMAAGARYAAAVGGIPEVIVDGVSGMLVAPGDSASLAKALKKISRPRACRAHRRRRARDGPTAPCTERAPPRLEEIYARLGVQPIVAPSPSAKSGSGESGASALELPAAVSGTLRLAPRAPAWHDAGGGATDFARDPGAARVQRLTVRSRLPDPAWPRQCLGREGSGGQRFGVRAGGRAHRRGPVDVYALRALNLGSPPRWNQGPAASRIRWLTASAWTRGTPSVGDIHYLWQPNRHAHFLTLAQAHALTKKRLSRDPREASRQLAHRLSERHRPELVERAEAGVPWSTGRWPGSWWPTLPADLRDRWLRSVYQHCAFIRGWFTATGRAPPDRRGRGPLHRRADLAALGRIVAGPPPPR